MNRFKKLFEDMYVVSCKDERRIRILPSLCLRCNHKLEIRKKQRRNKVINEDTVGGYGRY